MLKLWKPFEEMMLPRTWDWSFPVFGDWKPALPFTDVEEKEDKYLMTAELPGFAPEEVKVTLKGNVLEIEGKHEAEGKEEGRSYRRHGEFRRVFRLPENVNAETIEAKMVNGLLTVALPKVEATKLEPKTIPVETKAIEEKAPEKVIEKKVETKKAKKAA